jgi:hypothetical protein
MTGKHIVAVVTGIAFALTGCATYTPSMAKLDASGAGANRQSTKGITVFVDEHISKSKSEKAFDTDLRDDGVVALLVTVQNRGTQPFEMKTMDVVLRDGAGTLKLLSADDAAERAKKSATARAIGWSLIVPIIGIPFAATASVMHTNKVNRQMREDFTAKFLSSATVEPGKDNTGYLFFESEKARGDFNALALEVRGSFVGAAEPVSVVTTIAPVSVRPPETAQPSATNLPQSPK